MSEALSDLDIAWERVVAARAQDDPSAEARALSLLEQGLYKEWRDEEAEEIGRQVVDLARRCPDGHEILQPRFEMWVRRGELLEEQASVSNGLGYLKAAREAYLTALDTFADAPGPLREEVRQRADAVLLRHDLRREERRRKQEQEACSYARSAGSPHLVVEMIIGGFLAVKVLGPFLEEWARKLGEQLGESTARALGRIRVRRAKDGPELLEASVPGAPAPTTLVLPGRLSDLAKLAIIDLDPAAEAVRGQTLYWSEREGTWLSLQGRFAAFRARHPEVTVSDDGQSASWSDVGGPHTLSCGSMGTVWLIGYLEDQFDR